MANPSLQKILNTCLSDNPDCDVKLIERAYEFAQKIHQGQKRASGEDYITHCLAAAEIITDLRVGSKTIAATLLHDVLDDIEDDRLASEKREKELENEFGKEITRLVKSVTKIGKIKYHGSERAVENLRKMFLAIAEDIRVVLIKLADRLHNMRTLAALPPEKQKRIALETREIFVPLADRLSIGQIKGELEDLAFKHLAPGEYQWLVNQVKDQYEERERYLQKIIPQIKKELFKEGLNPLEIFYRAKHYWSLYLKLKRYEMNLNRIYDLVALRIIVPSVEDCYATLGVIHKLWRPLPGRIKDYIALPKPNGYQSIHTTVFSQGGKITEIQIRTPNMHEEAERGIAAHWHYSEQKGLASYIKKFFLPAPQKELAWIQQLQQWQKEVKGAPEDFFQSLKIDFFKDRIFVFTPKGDVINLPDGATPLDFAYHIHSDVGNHYQGAKVDGKMVAMDKTLQNGQVVEIITQKQSRPSLDWLKFTKTHQAQNRIRQWLSKSKETAKEILPEIKKETPAPTKLLGKVLLAKPTRLKAEAEVPSNPKIKTTLAKCCAPEPPADIIGYITLAQHITVHRRDCYNLTKVKDPARLIEVRWKKD